MSDILYIITNDITLQQFYLSKWTDRQCRGRVAVLVVISITVHQEVSCGIEFRWGDHLFTHKVSGSSVDLRLQLTSSCGSHHQYPPQIDRLKQLVDDWQWKWKCSYSQHNVSKREGTWWEGPGWDRGHYNPSGRSRHVGHLLPVFSIQTPAAGSVGKHCSGNTNMSTHCATPHVLHIIL